MSLDYITMGQSWEVWFFWGFGAVILSIGLFDTLYKMKKDKKDLPLCKFIESKSWRFRK